MGIIEIKINRFYSLIKNAKEGDSFTRYKSWEWCHKTFLDKRVEYQNSEDENEKNEIVDYLSLHLAFYLASWGMYRGSSFLLKRDYKTHKKVVKEIIKTDYNKLWDYKPSEDSNIDITCSLLFNTEENNLGIYYFIKNSYVDEESEDDVDSKSDLASDTLTTKILMGTFGCLPAFDRYLKSGLTAYKNHKNNYTFSQNIEDNNQRTFRQLVKFAKDNIRKLNIITPPGYKPQITYPPMKCVDMFFWEIGYEKDILEGLNDAKSSDAKKSRLIRSAKSLGLCEKNTEDLDEIKRQIENRINSEFEQ